ncbi:MAG: hypothetical protein EA401_07465 [Planctomycetota bacterium]|nr:MAG: hypothetical protein EA401_07465 [Planctomycetota bacterium]
MASTPFGFWMNRRGRLHRITEHGWAVIENPRRFGLTRTAVEAIVGAKGIHYNPNARHQDSPRGRLYRAVMSKGWIRLRGGQSGWSIQFMGNEPQVLRLLLRRIKPEYWGDATALDIGDLQADSKRFLLAGELAAAIAALYADTADPAE